MPVFEYKCSKCGTKFEIFHKSTVNQEEVICPECSSKEITKLFSSFSPSTGHSHAGCESGSCPAGLQSGGCPGGMCGVN